MPALRQAAACHPGRGGARGGRLDVTRPSSTAIAASWRWDRAAPRFFTRSGKDWTEKFAALRGAFDDVTCDSALIDGEVMAAQIRGSAFSSLQRALSRAAALVFFAFDLLSLDGEGPDRRCRRSTAARGSRPCCGHAPDGALRLTEQVRGNGAEMFRRACEAGAEGIVSKRVDAPYTSGRGRPPGAR